VTYNTRGKQYGTGVPWVLELTDGGAPADISTAVSVVINAIQDGKLLFREETTPVGSTVTHEWAEGQLDVPLPIYLTVEAWWIGGTMTPFPLLGPFKHYVEPLGYVPTPP
jgi:hypothetical protein